MPLFEACFDSRVSMYVVVDLLYRSQTFEAITVYHDTHSTRGNSVFFEKGN